MAKAKAKGAKVNPMSSRVQFLYQAAVLLAQQHSTPVTLSETTKDDDTPITELFTENLQPLSQQLVSDLRNVSLKAQIRLALDIKHTICKNCNTILLEGSTCSKEIENNSKGGKKPWADVMVQKCNICGLAKRFPLAARRQKRRPLRAPQTQKCSELKTPQEAHMADA